MQKNYFKENSQFFLNFVLKNVPHLHVNTRPIFKAVVLTCSIKISFTQVLEFYFNKIGL